MPLYRIISLTPKYGSVGGELYMFQPGDGSEGLPFQIKKVLFMRGMGPGDHRGGHAHDVTEEILVCLRGHCLVLLDDGRGNRAEVRLSRPDQALLLYPRVWRLVKEFAPETELLAVASHPYDERDYIRDRARFEKLAGQWNGDLGGSWRTRAQEAGG